MDRLQDKGPLDNDRSKVPCSSYIGARHLNRKSSRKATNNDGIVLFLSFVLVLHLDPTDLFHYDMITPPIDIVSSKLRFRTLMNNYHFILFVNGRET